MSSEKHNSEKKPLGLWTLTALVAGNMIGSGVFLLPSSLAKIGSISILAWMFTSVGALSLALVFAKLSFFMPKTGGPYAYCHETFGDFMGFQIAYNYWIALWVGNAAIAVAFTSYLSVFFPFIVSDRLMSGLSSIAIVWILTAVNVWGIRQAGIVQMVTTILKLLPLLGIAFVGLFYIHPQYFMDFNVSGESNFDAFTTAGALTLWSFIGVESATIPADSVDNPRKNIPRATIMGVIIASVVYIAGTAVIMGVLPNAELAKSISPYADAAKIIFGQWGAWIIALGAVISCLGALNGWILLQGQIPYAVAKDGLFPSIFTKQNRRQSPWVGLVVSSIFITCLLILTIDTGLISQFTLIILLATLAELIPYLYSVVAELIHVARHREVGDRKRLIAAMAVGIFALCYIFWAIIGSGQRIVFFGCLLFLSGGPVYALMHWKKRLNPEQSVIQ